MKTKLPMTLAALAAAALLLTGCSAINSLTGNETRDDDGTIVEGGDTDVFSIKVGDCIAESTGTDEVTEVPTVPCTDPHDTEVYADFEIAGSDYPGEDAIFAEADQGCYDAFAPFVGIAYEESAYDFSYYYPTEGSWGQGDHLISCLILDPSGAQVTGSLAGAAK